MYVEDSRINWKSGIMIEFVRLTNGLQKKEFSEKFDISQTELDLIEDGYIEPRTSLIKSICSKTKLNFDQMCGLKPATAMEAMF